MSLISDFQSEDLGPPIPPKEICLQSAVFEIEHRFFVFQLEKIFSDCEKYHLTKAVPYVKIRMNKKLFIHCIPQIVRRRLSVEDKRTELYRCAKELFSKKGFKDTNVADITKAAGFGVGTFYNYYSSKEKLFMEIYMEENNHLSKDLLASIDLSQEPITLIKQLLILNMEKMLANPILCQWYNRDVSGRIEKLFREETGSEANNFLYQTFYVLVQKWQAEGKMRSDIDSEMIMAIFGAIIKIGFYKEEIGLKYFPQLQDYLTEFVLKGLTDCRGAGNGNKAPA